MYDFQAKKNYILWKTSAVLMMMLSTTFVSYIPYRILTQFGQDWAFSLIIIPLALMIMMPIWAKIKNHVGHQRLLQINTVASTICIVITYIPFLMDPGTGAEVLLIIGMIFTGIFFAGLIPMYVSGIKSYAQHQGFKTNVYRLLGATCFWVIPVPYIIEFYAPNAEWVNMLIMGIMGVIAILVIFISGDITLQNGGVEIHTEQFNYLSGNWQFWVNVTLQNIVIGFMKAIEWTLPFLIAVKLVNKNYSLDISSLSASATVLWLVVIGYVAKYFVQGIMKFIRVSENHMLWVNKLGLGLVILGLLIACFMPWICLSNYNIDTDYTKMQYAAIILFQIISAAGVVLMQKSKSKYFQSSIGDNAISMALFIDHWAANSLFSVLFSIITLASFSFAGEAQVVKVFTGIFTSMFILSIVVLGLTFITMSSSKRRRYY